MHGISKDGAQPSPMYIPDLLPCIPTNTSARVGNEKMHPTPPPRLPPISRGSTSGSSTISTLLQSSSSARSTMGMPLDRTVAGKTRASLIEVSEVEDTPPQKPTVEEDYTEVVEVIVELGSSSANSSSRRSSESSSPVTVGETLAAAAPTPPSGRLLPSYVVRPVVPRYKHSILGFPLGAAVAQPHCSQKMSSSSLVKVARPPRPPQPRDIHGLEALEAVLEQKQLPSFSDAALNPLHVASGQWMVFFIRDECAERERLWWSACLDGMQQLPLPPTWERDHLHPKLAEGLERLQDLEGIARGYVEQEERTSFDGLSRLYEYEHRVLVVGTLPLERALCTWIARRRGRKVLQHMQRERLLQREAQARGELYEMEARRRKRKCVKMLESTEVWYRKSLELLQAQTSFVVGLGLLRLEEQNDRFHVAFGRSMAAAKVSGWTSGTTVFSRVVLAEKEARQVVEEEQIRAWTDLPYDAMRNTLETELEIDARVQILREEHMLRMPLEYQLCELLTIYTLRDVEVYEAMDSHIDLTRHGDALLYEHGVQQWMIKLKQMYPPTEATASEPPAAADEL